MYIEAKTYPDLLLKEMFEPDQPWVEFKRTKEYLLESRVSVRNNLCVHSNAKINCTFDELEKIVMTEYTKYD